MRKHKGKIPALITWCMLMLCLSLFMASSAKADMGPKPSVKIMIENIPEQQFVLALLTKDDEHEDRRDYLKEKTDMADPCALMKQKIYEYEVDGWKLAFSPSGTPFMVDGDYDGLTMRSSDGRVQFTYYAPSNFKVMLVTEDGSQYVSNEITTTRFSAECIYDLATGELTENLEAYQEHDRQEYYGMAKIYLVGTLMVEGFLLILFGLSQAGNLPIFFLAMIIAYKLAMKAQRTD